MRMKAFIESILGHGQPVPRWLRVLTGAALLALALWYAGAALRHGRMNNLLMEYNDQRVYMNYAKSFATPGFNGFIPRMRMPLYARVLSLATHPHMTAEQFFPVAQAFNVVLSLACLLVLFLFLRRWMGDWLGICFCLVVAFQSYILRAAYVQPEIILATLITLACAQLVETLRRPVWWNAVLAGLLLCAWFQTKASAQLALYFFLAVLGMKWIFAGKGRRWPYARAGIIVVLAYILPMSSYLVTSWKVFGDPFYNVQGKYYIWCEPPVPGKEMQDEKHMLQKLDIDESPKNLPSDQSQLPSAKRYFKNHTWEDIKARERKGLWSMFKFGFIDFPLLSFMLAVWAAIAVWAISRRWRDAARDTLQCYWEILFIVVLVTVFVLLFGWFTPLKVGSRLIESIALIPLFFCAAVAHHYLKDEYETIAGIKISMEKLLVCGFLIFWAVATIMQVPDELLLGYYGG